MSRGSNEQRWSVFWSEKGVLEVESASAGACACVCVCVRERERGRERERETRARKSFAQTGSRNRRRRVTQYFSTFVLILDKLLIFGSLACAHRFALSILICNDRGMYGKVVKHRATDWNDLGLHPTVSWGDLPLDVTKMFCAAKIFFLKY